MSPTFKAALMPVVLYAAGIPMLYVLRKNFRSGPCTLNLDIIGFLLFFCLCALLLLIDVYYLFRRQKARLISIPLHIIGLAILLHL